MSKLDALEFIPRDLRADHRGWLLKVINGKEVHLPAQTGEFYITLANPGQLRGNHYHPLTSEWFTVIIGQALLVVADPETNERREFMLDASQPVTVYIPAGVGHVFKNTHATETMVLVAYADHLYVPEDTIRMDIL